MHSGSDPAAGLHTQQQCWWCEDCGNGSHEDELPLDPDEGHWIGGTFVNMCNIAYSECFDYHDLCEPSEDKDEPRFTTNDLDRLERAIQADHVERVDELLRQYAAVATFIPSARAIQVTTCGGRLFANMPVGEMMATALTQSQAE